MAKGISIGVASDTREFSKGVKTGVIKPLEDASDTLDDVARDGDKAGDKLEKAMEGAQRETEDLAKEQTELGKSMARASSDGSGALKRNMTDGTSAAKRDLQELGNEAKQNAAETFSSFDGSASSFGDAIQGTLGGVVSSLGPIGAAAGAAGAIGIGLIMTALDQANVDNEEFRQSVKDLATDLIDTGTSGGASIGYIADRLKDLATESDDGEISLSKIRAQAEKLDIPFKDLAQSYAGGTANIEDQIAAVQDLIDEENDHYRENVTQYNQYDLNAAAKVTALEEQKTSLEKVAKATEEARQQEADWAAVGGPELQLKNDLIDDIQSGIDDAAGSWEDFAATEEKAIDPAGYLASIQVRMDAAIGYAANLQTAQDRLSPEAYQYLVDQGIDFAPMLASILSGGDAMITDFNTKFTAAANAGNAAIDGTLATDLSVSVEVKPELTEAEQKLKATEDKERGTKVTAKAETTTAEADLKAAAAKTYTAKITAQADVAAAERALDRLIDKARSVKVVATVVDRAGRPVI
ncbi:hypothetical protein [Cryobacterium luteum]|uniref:Uncharacterized protein n=1 Tax=Cryobacterium luteum TaxID=1424661 RepID=A0A1H8ARI9_9MICO|nr:hypothetical protein [Cryobacterium luteum]TFB88614.1 hypothetical protein E3O10_12610 [Cryobacterium luteum]SEM73315.1 hypothetical protein SAMN05216281_101304 [Cryobacterium luteum]